MLSVEPATSQLQVRLYASRSSHAFASTERPATQLLLHSLVVGQFSVSCISVINLNSQLSYSYSAVDQFTFVDTKNVAVGNINPVTVLYFYVPVQCFNAVGSVTEGASNTKNSRSNNSH